MDLKTTIAWTLLTTGRTLDIGSTLYKLHQGCVEQNPVYGRQPSVTRVVATQAAAVGIVWVLQKTGHPTVARWLAYGEGGSGVAAGVSNLRMECK